MNIFDVFSLPVPVALFHLRLTMTLYYMEVGLQYGGGRWIPLLILCLQVVYKQHNSYNKKSDL